MIIDFVYLILKKKLEAKLTDVKMIEWDESKDIRPGELKTEPAVFLSFEPFDTVNLQQRSQMMTVVMNARLITKNLREGDKRVRHNAAGHLALARELYIALQQIEGGLLSEITEFEALQGTDDDCIIINEITRVGGATDHSGDSLQITDQRFRITCYDHSAQKAFVKTIAGFQMAAGFEGDEQFVIESDELSAFTLSDQVQTPDPGDPILPIVPSVIGTVKEYVLALGDVLPDGLVMNGGVVSGIPTTSGSFRICAISDSGKVIGVQRVAINEPASAVQVISSGGAFNNTYVPADSPVLLPDQTLTVLKDAVPVATPNFEAMTNPSLEVRAFFPKTALSEPTYSPAAQTVWLAANDAQGKGAPIDAVPNLTHETGSFVLTGTVPAGVSIHPTTGVISSVFANLPSGLNTINWQKTGTGDYSGVVSGSITITKNTRWFPTSGFETAVLRPDVSLDFMEANGKLTPGVSADEVSSVLSADNVTSYSQAVSGNRPTITKRASGRNAVGTTGTSALTSSISAINGNFTIWLSGVINPNFGHVISNGTNSQLRFNSLSIVLTIQGTSISFNLTKQQAALINNVDFAMRFKHNSGAHELEVRNRDGVICSLTDSMSTSGDFITNNITIMARTSGTANGAIGVYSQLHVTTGNASTNDKNRMFTHMLYEMTLSDYPAF